MHPTQEQTTKQARTRLEILGLRVDKLTLADALNQIEEWVAAKQADPSLLGRRIITANPEYVMRTRRDPELKQVVNSADMVTPDGFGLILAGIALRRPFTGRVTGVALSYALAERSAKTELKLFLLGAGPGVAEEAAAKFNEMYPGVKIVGVFAGKAGPEGDEESLEKIRAAQPDIVLVAYGMVKQDYWALRNINNSGAAVAIGVGGVLDYVSGRVPLAPSTLRRMGLEWAYRLYKEPWRWRRMTALPVFAVLVAGEAVRNFINSWRKN